jgi:methionyl-tRNA formyltransferase
LPAIAARQVKSRPQEMFSGKRRVRPQIDNRARWLDFNDSVERVLLQVRAFTKPYGGIAALVDDRPLLVYRAEKALEFNAAGNAGDVNMDGEDVIVHCQDGAVRLISFEFLD